MDAVTHNTLQGEAPASGVTVRLEVVAIVALIVISLLLRLTDLGAVPLTETETQQALSAWRATWAQTPGSEITAASPITYWGQRLAFGTLGGSEVTARLFTALAGVLVGLSPLLFRGLLGRARAYLFAVLLTLSPVLLAASRLGSGTVWVLLLAAVGLWAIWRYWESSATTDEALNKGYGILAMATFGGMVLLAEPAGPVLGLILLGAGAVALSLATLDAPDEADLPGGDFLASVRQRLRDWPWISGGAIIALIVTAISTGFLVQPGGLNMVAELLGGFISGFTQGTAGAPLFFPLLVSLFYEPWIWGFAIAGLILLWRAEAITFVERFLIAWLILAGIAALIYSGAGAAHALWLSIPLAGLASYVAADLLNEEGTPPLWLDDFEKDEISAASQHRGKWLMALVMFGLLMAAAVHFQVIARGFTQVPDGALPELIRRLGEPAFVRVTHSFIWLTVSLLFMGVGSLLAASVWGNRPALRGGALGVLAFALLTSTASGWNVTASRAESPAQPWHVRAPSLDAEVLRVMATELAFRETRGFPHLPVTVVGADDGLVAWLLRDFVHARFVSDLADARAEPVVITPVGDLPDLGGSYVGRQVTLSRDWSPTSMQGFDFLAWWSVGTTRLEAQTAVAVMLWVRQDVFDGQPVQPLLSGSG
jgi:hypothetical protein